MNFENPSHQEILKRTIIFLNSLSYLAIFKRNGVIRITIKDTAEPKVTKGTARIYYYFEG